MRSRHLLLAVGALAVTGAALAQYQWIDANGGHVFSDQPPPASVPEKNILSAPDRPTGARPANAGDASDEDAQTRVSSSAPAVAQPARSALKKKVEAEDAKRRADEAARRRENAAARADNCKRAQDYQRALDSGMRMARINEKGERIVLDDAGRAAERKRTQAAITANCAG